MRAFALVAVSLVLALFASTDAGEKRQQSGLVGHWEVVKSEEAPVGSSVEFTADGRLILIPKGKEDKKLVASYKVEGKKITTVRKEKGKEETNVLTIQTLNESSLIVQNDRGGTDELKKARAKSK